MSSFKVDSLTGITGIIYLEEPLNYRKLILTQVCVHFQKFTGLLPINPFIHPSIFQATCHTVYRVTGCWSLFQRFGPHQLFFTENRQNSAPVQS